MAQELLDGLQVSAGHDQPGSEGVTQVVETEIHDPRLSTGALEAFADVGKPSALGVAEESRWKNRWDRWEREDKLRQQELELQYQRQEMEYLQDRLRESEIERERLRMEQFD